MSDFAPGDVAVCVGPLDPDDGQRGMFKGRYYTVSSVEVSDDGVGLLFQEGCDPSPWDWWQAGCFRKVKHADEQFTQQMRSLKPVKVSSNV